MTAPTLPPAMVEAAARALADANTEISEAWIFDGRYPQYEPRREQYRVRARWVLTAAFGVCKVNEEWGYRSLWSQVTDYRASQVGAPDHDPETWTHGEQHARNTVGASEAVPRQLIRRLHITTPTEDVGDLPTMP